MRFSLRALVAAGLTAAIGISCASVMHAEPQPLAALTRPAPQPQAVRIYDGRGLSLVEDSRVAALYENLIRQSVDPKSWKERHGAGEISNAHGMFVILQTPANHSRIQELFARLHDSGPSEDGVVTLTFDIGDFIDRRTRSVEAAKAEVLPGDTRTPPTPPVPTLDEYLGQLLGLITDTISRDSWVENGGTVGTIRRSDRQLIVRQTIEDQRKLARLFEQLREFIDDPPPKAEVPGLLVGSKLAG